MSGSVPLDRCRRTVRDDVPKSFRPDPVGVLGIAVLTSGFWLLTGSDGVGDPQSVVPVVQSTAGVEDQFPSPCDLRCATDRAVALVKVEGPEAAVAYADAIEDPIVRLSCHGLYHAIGRAAAQDGYPAYISDECQYGYLHGVLQARALSFDDTDAFIDDVVKYCDGLKGRDNGECRHGIGHALAVATPGDIHAAMRTCARLPDKFHMDSLCAGGLLMEYAEDFVRNQGLLSRETNNGTSSDEGVSLTAVGDIDFESLCSTAPHNIQGECFRRISSFIFPLHPMDTDKISEVCGTAPDENSYRQCHLGFGVDYIGTLLERERDLYFPETPAQVERLGRTILDKCETYPEVGVCIESAVINFSHLYSAGYADKVPPVCEMVKRRWLENCESGLREAKQLAGIQP